MKSEHFLRLQQIIIIFLFFPLSDVAASIVVSPFDYGLNEAKTPEDRYWALYRAHIRANELGTSVDYSGIEELTIAIPEKPKTIPVQYGVDFKGLKLTVINNTRDISLFRVQVTAKPFSIDKSLIDGDDFRNVAELSKGAHLLIIEDKNPWVANREGFNYGASRKDIRLIVDGWSKNKSIKPYNNGYSTPICSYAPCSLEPTIFTNLGFIRDSHSQFKTGIVEFYNCNNVVLDQVYLQTPDTNGKTGDRAIYFENCTNVTIKDVVIDGTYSKIDFYGYGISLNNVWNTRCLRIKGDANWGIFCANNINKSYLRDCNINRYDCHCYGKDITAEDCTFRGMANHYSSVYGKLIYKNCVFDEFRPVHLRAEYNTYVPFDLEIINCTMYISSGRKSIVYMGRMDSGDNARYELRDKSWPNIRIRGLKVIPKDDTKNVYLFEMFHLAPNGFKADYISTVDIRKLEFSEAKMTFELSNMPIVAKNKIKLKLRQKMRSHAILLTDSLKGKIN